MNENNDITLNDIKRIIERAPTFQNSNKSSKQIREELKEVDKIGQGFMENKKLCPYEEERKETGQEINNPEEKNRMNKVLMAVMNDHKSKVNQMGSLNEEDIPHLREEWKKSCKNIMNTVDLTW